MKHLSFSFLLFYCILFINIPSWAQQSPNSNIDRPSQRGNYSKWNLDNKLYLFGGLGDNSDLWEFDLNAKSWKKIYTGTVKKGDAVTGPVNRRDAATWTYEGKLYLFGGFRGLIQSEESDYYNDIWAFDPLKGSWRCVMPFVKSKTIPEKVPIERANATYWLLKDVVVITMGMNRVRKAFLNDVWVFDLKKESWTNVRKFVDVMNNFSLATYELAMQKVQEKISSDSMERKIEELRRTLVPVERTAFDTLNFPMFAEYSIGFVVNDRLLIPGVSQKLNKLCFWEFSLSEKSWRVVPGTFHAHQIARNTTECDASASPGLSAFLSIYPVQNNKAFSINAYASSTSAWIYDFEKRCWRYVENLWGRIDKEDAPLMGEWNIWWQIDNENIGYMNMKINEYWALNTSSLKWVKK